jgi:NAD(P)-dependent dehydrogenase (short-subunit alcohol dehydrogenase family)
VAQARPVYHYDLIARAVAERPRRLARFVGGDHEAAAVHGVGWGEESGRHGLRSEKELGGEWEWEHLGERAVAFKSERRQKIRRGELALAGRVSSARIRFSLSFYLSMTLDLTGRHVLVTGASRGIGRALAEAMGDAGARVAVHYHRRREAAEAVAETAGHGAQPFQADLADDGAAGALFEEVVDAFGQVDVLVNNAGVARALPLEANEDDWRAGWHETMAVNLRAPEALCRRAVPHFRQNGGGRVISVASRAAFRGDTPPYLAYAASKAGLVALTRSLARAFGADGLRAFTLAPGFTRTDMAQDFIDEYGEDYALEGNALGRLTEPEDLAATAVLLASGRADHATGTTIDLNAASYVH